MFRNLLKLPVLLVTLMVALMFMADRWFAAYRFGLEYQGLCAFIIFASGVLIVTAGGYAFKKASTTVNPMTPEKTTQLVTSGVYRLSRNPMYVGFFLWLTAAVIYIGNVVNLIFLPVFVLVANVLYIRPEEEALRILFGDAFTEYVSMVRRWI